MFLSLPPRISQKKRHKEEIYINEINLIKLSGSALEKNKTSSLRIFRICDYRFPFPPTILHRNPNCDETFSYSNFTLAKLRQTGRRIHIFWEKKRENHKFKEEKLYQ